MKLYRPIKPEPVSDGAKDVSFSQKLWEKKHPLHRPTLFFFFKRSNPLYVGIQYKTTVTKFTGWVTEMFTFQLNVYTVAISLQQLIVIIKWLGLNIRGFLM